MSGRARSAGSGVAVIAALLLSGCAPSSPSGATSSAPARTPATTAPAPVPESSSPPTVPDWAQLQADLTEADARLASANEQGWWAGPVCSPDIEQHREQAGQAPLSDERLRAECAATLAQFRASAQDYDSLQALDGPARVAEGARVGAVLGLPAGQEPTVGQLVLVHGCEQGWIADPADCAGVPAG